MFNVQYMKIAAGATKTIHCRLTTKMLDSAFVNGFDEIFRTRKQEADDYYAAILPSGMSGDMTSIQRQALAGLLVANLLLWTD